MRRNLTLAACLAFALGTLACQNENTSPNAPPDGISQQQTLQSLTDAGRQLVLKSSPGRITDQYLPDLVDRVIDPDDYVCDPNSPLFDFYDAQLQPVIDQENEIYTTLLDFAATQIPQVEALYLLTTDTPQYFGYNGEYTKVMNKAERDIKRFWDIFSEDIQVLGMHGSMLLDEERVAAAYVAGFTLGGQPIPPAVAAQFAAIVADALRASQTLNGGNHPVFSFNAFAITAPGFIPDKIVMGDGILAGYDAVGFGDVAPQAVFAHEFAHHIQFENGYFNDVIPGATTQAERTRYTELMADAYAAYYLTHKRGATMNRKRVEQFLEVFFQIGDCSYGSPNHHGTPNQRMAAARFGFDLADQAQKQGHILTSAQFHALFVTEYPDLIAPDAP